MNRKIVPMLGIAAIFGSLSIFAANMWLENAAEARAPQPVAAPLDEAPRIEFGSIVVARQPLRYGSALDAQELEEIPWPKDTLPAGAYASVEDVMRDGNRVVLSPLEANEPVLLAKLSGPNGRATLSNKLTPGMQAVTIAADEITGVGGFLTQGDRVDVVLTRNGGSVVAKSIGAEEAGRIKGAEMITETVVSGARVLSAGAEDNGSSGNGTVTLEVTPSDARRIALARSVGQVSLSLLAATEGEGGARDSATLSSLTGLISSGLPDGQSLSEAMTSDRAKMTEVKVTRGILAETYNVPLSGNAREIQP